MERAADDTCREGRVPLVPSQEQGIAPIRPPRAASARREGASRHTGCIHSVLSWTPTTCGGSGVVLPAWCSQPPTHRRRRRSGLGALLGTGNSLSERLHGVRAAQGQDNARRLLSTKLRSSRQLHLAGLFPPPPPPHLLARHRSQPQLRSRGDGSSTSVISEMQTGAVA